MFQNLYINPQNSAKSADGSHLTNVSDEEMQEHYDNFFEDVFVEAEDKWDDWANDCWPVLDWVCFKFLVATMGFGGGIVQWVLIQLTCVREIYCEVSGNQKSSAR